MHLKPGIKKKKKKGKNFLFSYLMKIQKWAVHTSVDDKENSYL